MPKRLSCDDHPIARFITFCTHKRYPLFDVAELCEIVLHHIRRFRDDNQLKILAFVIMPEHVHLLLISPETVNLASAIGRLKGLVAHEIIQYWRANTIAPPDVLCTPVLSDRQHIIWMPGWSDRPVRGEVELREMISYVHAKPVMRRLVDEPKEWRWSSYRWYLCCGDVILEMDEVAL